MQAVIADTEALKLRQETPDTPEALATVPMLHLSDLDPKIKTIPIAEEELGGAQVLSHDLFTSGIVYLDLGFDLHGLPQELLPYVPLFGRSLLQLGTETEDFVRLTQRIGQKTGGIAPQAFTSTVRGQTEAASWLFLRGKATVAQTPDLLDILRDIILTRPPGQPGSVPADGAGGAGAPGGEPGARRIQLCGAAAGGPLHGGGLGQRADGRRQLPVLPARLGAAGSTRTGRASWPLWNRSGGRRCTAAR